MSLDERIKNFRARLNSSVYNMLGSGRLAEALTGEIEVPHLKIPYGRRVAYGITLAGLCLVVACCGGKDNGGGDDPPTPPANHAPTVKQTFADVYTDEDVPTSVDGVASHFSDQDGDTLTYSVLFADINAILNGNKIDINAPANYNGSETGKVKACDTHGACVEAPLKVTFNPVNDAPVINSITMTSAQEGAFLNGTVNVADVDGDALTCGYYNNGGLLELVVNTDCTITSTVPIPYSRAGTYTATFWVKDGKGGESTLDENINVTNTNRAPVITDVVINQAQEGAVLDGDIFGNDPDSDLVSCYLVSTTLPELKVSPGCGIYSDAALPPAVPVDYSVVVGMTDGSIDDTMSKDFEVQRPPTKPSSTCSGLPCGPGFIIDETPLFPLEFTLTSTDPNPGDVVTYQSSALPTGATLDPNTGVFSWSPTCSQGGVVYSPTFQAKDDKGHLSDGYSVIITVNDVCPP